MGPRSSIEECLIEIEEKAALVRYFAGSAVTNQETPDRAVLGGVETVCTEIETRARDVRRTLTAEMLAIDVKVRR